MAISFFLYQFYCSLNEVQYILAILYSLLFTMTWCYLSHRSSIHLKKTQQVLMCQVYWGTLESDFPHQSVLPWSKNVRIDWCKGQINIWVGVRKDKSSSSSFCSVNLAVYGFTLPCGNLTGEYYPEFLDLQARTAAPGSCLWPSLSTSEWNVDFITSERGVIAWLTCTIELWIRSWLGAS